MWSGLPQATFPAVELRALREFDWQLSLPNRSPELAGGAEIRIAVIVHTNAVMIF